MVAPPEPIALRKTVIGGETAPDDYVVVWDGLVVGRILKQPGVPSGRPNWSWSVILPNVPQQSWQRGLCSDLEECKRRFRVAWTAVHGALTDAQVAAAREIGERPRPWDRR